MTKKQGESNLLPFVFGGIAAVAAGMVYKKYKESKEETTEDTWITDGGYSGNVGGSSDFFGNSTSVINPEYAPDSVANGIEDIARGDAVDGLTDPSAGGVNPNNYGTNGLDIFADVAYDIVTDPLVIAGAGGYALNKAGKVMTRNLPKSGKVLSKAGGVLARGSVVGAVIEGTNMLLDATGTKDAVKDVVTEIVGGESIVTPIYDMFYPSAKDKAITTDQAATEAYGNVVYDSGKTKSNTVPSTGTIYVKTDTPRYVKTDAKQLQVATGLQSTGSKNVGISAGETAVVNDALGTSGTVIKQTYGSSGTTYVGAGGKQLTYAGTDLQTAASAYKTHNAGNQSQTSTSQTPSYRH